MNFNIRTFACNYRHCGTPNISCPNTTYSFDRNTHNEIKNYLNEIVPENKNYAHSTEGPDDMPAHLKTLLTQTNLTLSLKNKNNIWIA